MEIKPGQSLLHYRLVDSIGSGGMGEVFRAEDSRLKRQVALKVLPPEMAADPERRQRFEREAQAVAALNHPNIVTIHSVERSEELHFITMELIDGEPLSRIELPDRPGPAGAPGPRAATGREDRQRSRPRLRGAGPQGGRDSRGTTRRRVVAL